MNEFWEPHFIILVYIYIYGTLRVSCSPFGSLFKLQGSEGLRFGVQDSGFRV